MPETPTRTPGQVAYTAYMAVLALSFPMDFAALPDTYHRAWEAAAQAVRTQALKTQENLDAQANLMP